MFRTWSRQIVCVTDFLWQACLPKLCAWKKSVVKKNTERGSVTCLGGCVLPQNVEHVLSYGPMLCTEPRNKAPGLVAMVKRITNTVDEEERGRCTSEGVDCLLSKDFCSRKAKLNVKASVEYLKSHDLALLVSDKEGGFVVMPKQLFPDKAGEAINKNFVQTRLTGASLKKYAIALCKKLNFSRLEKRIEEADRTGLNVFFSAKTHKPDVPLRAIVNEVDSWQGILSRFLQKSLKRLPVNDPYRVAKEVIRFFSHEGRPSGGDFAFSIDIVDLFYSIPQSDILTTVKKSIE